MLQLRDLFQWERFITPSIIKIFYWLTVIIALLFGLSGFLTGIKLLAVNPIAGLFTIITSFFGIFVGVICARIAAEFILIVFRISEHLGAIRHQRGM